MPSKIGDMYSLFEWCAFFFLITPFFSNSDTSIVFVLWKIYGWVPVFRVLAVQRNLFQPLLPSQFRNSSCIVICFHWAKQKRIWLALKSSDCFCNSSSILGRLSQESLTSFGSAFWFLAVSDFPPELSYPSLVPRFSSSPEAAVAPSLPVLQWGLVYKGPVLSAFVGVGPLAAWVVVLDFESGPNLCTGFWNHVAI